MIITAATFTCQEGRLEAGWSHATRQIPILVGGVPTPLKNMKVSWDDYSQLNGK